MKLIKTSVIPSVHAPRPRSYLSEWHDTCEAIQSNGHVKRKDKNSDVKLLSLVEFKRGRKRKNAVSITGIVVDWDDAEFQVITERLYGLEHLMYSSHSYAPENDAFKVKTIIPFKTPCTPEEWEERSEAIEERFEGCDKTSLRIIQFQAMPNCPKERKKQAFITRFPGDFFDPLSLPVNKQNPKEQTEKSVTHSTTESDNSISPDTVIRHKDGEIRAGDINSHIRDVYCPVHDDKNPTEFAKTNSNGQPYIVCKKCKTTYWVGSSDDYLDSKDSDESQSSEIAIAQPKEWDNVVDILTETCSHLSSDNIIYGPEGTGKSYLANLLANQGHNIIFACATNKQAEEKHLSLKKLGLKAKLLTSKAYEIEKRFGVKPVLYDKKHPWDIGRINSAATEALIQENHPDCDKSVLGEILTTHPQPSIDWDDCQVIITTHSRINDLGRSNAYAKSKNKPLPIDEGVIIFYDDPVVDDFLSIATFHAPIKSRKIGGEEIKTHTPLKSNATYYIKPESLTTGHGFEDNTVIYTTTELLIIELIKKLRPEIMIHDELLPANTKVDGGDVHLLSTKLVRSKVDGILPPIIERLKREGFDTEFIANGSGSPINLHNNKGNNSLAIKPTVVEISIPTRKETMNIYEQFGGKYSERVVNLTVMLDKLHQAVGRNSGYRFNGQSCVVLVDPQYYKAIRDMSRYSFKTTLEPDQDNPSLYPRRKPKFNQLADAVAWYVNRHQVYLNDGNKFKNDCIQSLKKLPENLKCARRSRLIKAINQLSVQHAPLKPKLTKVLSNLGENS